MNLEKVIFAFFIILALSLNFGFYTGDPTDPSQHEIYELFAALIVSLICTIMKFGDRSQYGSTVLASSLVADLHLMVAALYWHFASADGLIDGSEMGAIVSFAAGALIANAVSVVLLLIETIQERK